MTVILEDVSYILGIPVAGLLIVGDGLESGLGYFAKHWFEPLDEEEGKAYLLMVVGSVLFPNSSRNVVHPRGLEHAAQKGAKRSACCTWLLQLWAYERFLIERPLPDPTRDSYPVAEFWARPVDEVVAEEEEEDVEEEEEEEEEEEGEDEEPNGKKWKKGKEVKGKQVRGKEDVPETGIVVKSKRATGRRNIILAHPHSLPHYRGEFDGVAADIVAWWTQYAHFHEVKEDSNEDHNISAEDWEAHFFGLVRVPVLCYDVVEYQHFDRVMRQFDFRQGIPRSPVNMTEYRKPMIPFNPYDWRGIARMRVGKPHPVLEPQYSTQELFNNSHAFNLIQKGLACLQVMDNNIPPEYEHEFERIAPIFVEPYCRFMQDVRDVMKTLQPKGWLDDRIIYAYMSVRGDPGRGVGPHNACHPIEHNNTTFSEHTSSDFGMGFMIIPYGDGNDTDSELAAADLLKSGSGVRLTQTNTLFHRFTIFVMSSTLSLQSILDAHKLTGPNFADWLRNLRIVLRVEKLEYVLDSPKPTEPASDAHNDEHVVYHKWIDDANIAQCIMLASMNIEL
ncbi:hypothetical protein AgCh_027358 [Apium graveolens]